MLIDHFIGELAAEHGESVTGIDGEARAALVRYPWPGNVRELRNALENMVVLSRSAVLAVGDVPVHVLGGAAATREGGSFDLTGRTWKEVERELIAQNLELYEGNREQTAKGLGIGERTLYRKIKEFGL